MALAEYEEEYRGHVAAANEKAELAESAKLPDERRTALAAADRSVEAAKDVIQLMELEGRSLAPAVRTRLQTQLRGFRTEISELKSLLKELRSAKTVQMSPDCMREELFAAHSRDSHSEASERARMLQTNERLANGTDRLKDVNKVTLDMEHTANSILGDLASQRETLLRSRNTLRMASDGLEKSERLLRSIARRAMTNKLVLWVVIGLIVLLILMLFHSNTAAPMEVSKPPSGEWKKRIPTD